MTARAYKQWSPQERDASYRLTKKAIDDGLIQPAKALGCNRCKQKAGIIDYHNWDYSHPTKHLEPLCYTCHMVMHNFHNNPQAVFEYFERVWRGYQAPPVLSRDEFYKMMRREGIL